jgi:GNAT superfamily N-acetyltransferase
VTSSIRVEPLTAKRWDDLVELFGPRGAYAGCWCMWYRLSQSEFSRRSGTSNRRGLNALVRKGSATGLLAYQDGRAVGWCSVAPRQDFGRIERSRVLARVDDEPVWSVVCFYIHRNHRGQGVATALLEGAKQFAARKGARVLEAYPVDPGSKQKPNADMFPGPVSLYQKAGFKEVTRRSKSRPIMRLEL